MRSDWLFRMNGPITVEGGFLLSLPAKFYCPTDNNFKC